MDNSYTFQAEINQLMSLIINSFYSNREIFLRELVSNSSDAIDKHRHETLSAGNSAPNDYSIKIIPDTENKTLTILDNGIGMTKQDLIDNLGTIARSGTKAFMEKLSESKDSASLIGQFGVGFYSAYLVADNLKVYTVKDNESHVWESSANGTFTINENTTEMGDMTHGTKMVLYLKDDQHEFLEETKIKSLVKKHNQFITHPIQIYTTKTVLEEVEDPDPEPEISTDDAEVTVEDVEQDKEKPKKKVEKKISEYEQINTESPIWTRAPDEVSADEYNTFYKTISNDWDTPLAKTHFSVEGQLEFKSLLYIPKRAPFDLFEKSQKQSNIKLYVKKVFVTDESEHLLPEWLGFVRGVVDSEDLPLNISREFLQQNRVLKTIQKNLIKKSLEMISNLDEKDSEEFYNNFSKCLKLGAYHESSHRTKLMKLLKFHSVKHDKMITLDEYVSGFVPEQKTIYFMCGESINGMKMSPFVERFKKLGIDVILMSDPIDEYMMQQIREYESGDEKHPFASVTRDGLKLPGETETEDTDEMKALCNKMKSVLADKVEKVVTSKRVVDAPTCIVTGEYGWSANMERIMKAQALRNDILGGMSRSKKIMEINTEHPLIVNLSEKLKKTGNLEKTDTDIIQLLYEVSLISSGFNFDDSSEFVKRMYRVISLGTDTATNTDENASVESEPEPEPELEPEPEATKMEDLD